MKVVKTVLVFFLGIAAGGLIFGFNGPASSQADMRFAPADLFVINNNLGGGSGKYKQFYYIRDQYKSRYEVVSAGIMAAHHGIWVSIKDK